MTFVNDGFFRLLTFGDNLATDLYWDIPRPVASVTILLACAARYGMSTEECLQGSGIDRSLLESPRGQVQARQELQVIRNLLAHVGPDQPLALEVGCRHHLTAFGIWGFGVLSSATFRDAVEMGLRYIRLTAAYCRIKPMIVDGEALLRVDGSELPDDLRDFLVERDLAALITLQRDLEPFHLPVKALRLQRPPPPYAEKVRELTGVEPEYSQTWNETSIPVELLMFPLAQSNPLTRRACEEECQKLLQQLHSRSGLSGKVRDRLARTPAIMPTMDELAEELALEPRTLRRRLAEEGTIYSELVDEVRGGLAEALLVGTDLSVEEIASRLGYSEPSAFSRAFKRWRSLSPRDYRRSHLAN